jgi:chromosome partitioning protein
MRTYAIINQKGGSGKTTTTVNIAAALGEKKRKVLIIDLDPQASTSAWLGVSSSTPSLLDVMTKNTLIHDVIITTKTAGVDIIPASSWLIGLEKQLAHEVGAETILKQKFNDLAATYYDYILIDCPPALSLLTINALNAVHEVLVPVETRIMALQGLVQLLGTIDIIKKRLNNQLHLSGILACRVDTRTKHSKEIIEELRKNFSSLVYSTVIRENIKLAECPSFTQSILSYAPESSGAQDYRLLAEEIIAQEVIYYNQTPSMTKGALCLN